MRSDVQSKTYSAFAYGTNEITFLPHTKKATVQTRRVLHSPSKGGKGRDRRGRGKRGSKEENRREREGREMPPFVPVLSFSLPSLSRRLSSLAVPPLNRCRMRKQMRSDVQSKRAEQAPTCPGAASRCCPAQPSAGKIFAQILTYQKKKSIIILVWQILLFL